MSSLSTLRARALATLPFMLALAGCAGATGGYPSLAPRPIESLSLTEPTRPAPAPAVADDAAVARYAPIIEQARADDESFHTVLKQERDILARGRGAPRGSDAWLAAQTAMSRVETARAPVAKALSDLDAARNSPPTETSTGEALAASQAFEQVRQIDEAETATLAGIQPPTH